MKTYCKQWWYFIQNLPRYFLTMNSTANTNTELLQPSLSTQIYQLLCQRLWPTSNMIFLHQLPLEAGKSSAFAEKYCRNKCTLVNVEVSSLLVNSTKFSLHTDRIFGMFVQRTRSFKPPRICDLKCKDYHMKEICKMHVVQKYSKKNEEALTRKKNSSLK